MSVPTREHDRSRSPGAGSGREAVRERLIEVAVALLHEHGPAAVTTRGVAAAAGVQAPTIYRLFGDKDGLLDAVAEHAAMTFVAAKAKIAQAAADEDADPLEDLRAAFLAQVDFGVANPAVFKLLSDPERARRSGVAEAGRRVLQARVHRLALAGLLRVEEARCVDLVQAAGTGVIQTLLSTGPERRDEGLAEAMWAAVMNQVLQPSTGSAGTDDRLAATLVTFRAIAPDMPGLSQAERALLIEWLNRPRSGGADAVVD
ncbi:TetR/AcrR family transcriptional regulator [Streptomyces sp. NP160]|uniref:TetR/AcrR family transcriptional regulator n=1 Tax=Streptomyces sp. NP160 TaxID=2586637 RepID=UPI001118EFE2|nr:TetR/AcrR family transcriptional regulator [Streptomyces sp. NP160]TNM59268.1 TetR/AcrR family transcriptional regulator [Streptomyces sp. NP160]